MVKQILPRKKRLNTHFAWPPQCPSTHTKTKMTLKGGEGPILSAYSPPHTTSGHEVTQRYLSRSPWSYCQYQRKGKWQDTRQEIQIMWRRLCDERTLCQVLINATTVLTFFYVHIHKILSSMKRKTTVYAKYINLPMNISSNIFSNLHIDLQSVKSKLSCY